MILLQLSFVASFFGGAFDGTAETLKFGYNRFDKVFPGANPQFWNPQISYLNKYKDADPNKGARYFGSTTFLAWSTDGYHAMRTARNACITTAIVSHRKKKKKWYKHVINGVAHLLAYQAGFHFTYSLIYKK